MADIHIGKITESGTSGRGSLALIYHIPIDSPKIGVVPSPLSSIDGQISQAERDALQAGSLVEMGKDIIAEDSQTQAEVASAMKADWQKTKAEYNRKYNFEYKFYGVTVNAAS